MHADLYVGWLHHATAYLKSSAANEVWVQSLILILSAGIAIVTLRSTSKSELRRATFNIVRDQQKDSVLIAARALVRGLQNAAGGMNVAEILSKQDSAEIQAIFAVLNSYEFVATGMNNGAFDRRTYKKMYRNNVVRTWDGLAAFVEAYRVRETEAARRKGMTGIQPATYYQDFEKLAERWAKRPLKVVIGQRLKWRRTVTVPAIAPVPAAQAVPAAGAPGVVPAMAADAAKPEAKKSAGDTVPQPPQGK